MHKKIFFSDYKIEFDSKIVHTIKMATTDDTETINPIQVSHTFLSVKNLIDFIFFQFSRTMHTFFIALPQQSEAPRRLHKNE